MSGQKIHTCRKCGIEFSSGWTDEQADAEYKANFPDEDGPMATVCSDCYEDFWRWAEEYHPELTRKR